MTHHRIRLELPRGFDLLALHARDPTRYPHLLESVTHGTPQARYDILFAFPGDTLRLDRDYQLHCPGSVTGNAGFLVALDDWCKQLEVAPDPDDELPYAGGWFVYLGYELAGEIEPSLQLPAGPAGWPVAFAQRCSGAIIRDHVRGCIWLVAEREDRVQLDRMRADIEALGNTPSDPPTAITISDLIEDDPQHYLDAVVRIKDYILAGDVFQVNLSRSWSGRIGDEISTADVYRRLRSCNPAPFAAMVSFDKCAIISSSPERLVSVRDGIISTRPIAGTRPRDIEAATDLALSTELLAHPKERAEHVMLIDLERNDLGRVCAAGSVEVDEFMALESYAHVHHIVSNVRGRLREGAGPGAVIRAVFPGGTITGCPKVRCMEIIAELEATGRGAYTGSVGYISKNMRMDMNILIRSMSRTGAEITWRAGAGIVADSIPEAELAECIAKAKGLRRVFL